MCAIPAFEQGKVKAVHRAIKIICISLMTACVALLGVCMSGTSAQAQSYTKLQILLPGETAAPGTPS